jgi:2OG-Fe(II) oxygenase superfamily
MKKQIFLLFLVCVILFLVMRSASGYEPFNPVREPPIVIPGVLTPEECECVMYSRQECPALTKLVELAASMSGKPVANCEPPLILRNDKGGERPLCSQNDSCSEFRDLGGERIGCLIVYLNDNFKGGELLFESNGGLRLKPDAGSAVFYRPLLTHRNTHKGLPVTAGTKYTCVIFVREQDSDKISVE